MGIQTLQKVAKIKPAKSLILLMVLAAFVAGVSVYDAYWAFKTQSVIVEFEKNPIGLYLIKLDGGDVALFMTFKMVGTMIVIMAIPALYFFRRWWGMAAAISLAVVQIVVFIYLTFGW